MAKQTVNDAEASELLLKMIKEEMTQTLLHNESGDEENEGMNQSDFAPLSPDESTAKMLDLADSLLNRLDDSHHSDKELRLALLARLHKAAAHSKSEDQTSDTALDSRESIENGPECDGDSDDDGMFWMHESTYNSIEDSNQDVTRTGGRTSSDKVAVSRRTSLSEDELHLSATSPPTHTYNSSIQDLLSQFPEFVDTSSDDEEKVEEDGHNYDEEDDSVDEFSCISDISGGFKSNFPPPPPSLRPSDAPSRKKTVTIENLSNFQRSPAGVTDLHKRFRQPHSVRFGQVHIRYHKMIVCDNPGNTGGGPSLGLGWHFHPISMEKPVDEYERERERHRRRGFEMAWSRKEREQIALHRLGCSRKDMVEMVRTINRIKMQRRQTVNNLGAEKMEAAVENVSRKFRSLFTVKRI